MSLLPKKTTPQEWIDVPLFGAPDPEPVARQRSKKQEDDDTKIVYRRYNSTARTSCQDCVEFGALSGGQGILNASYIRIVGTVRRYLCFGHRAERGNKELLGR
jgi:hypothetical protein